MIARIHPRGTRIGGLLAYLFGPGRSEDHASPRLVAAWEGAGDLAGLEPPVAGNGRRDVRALVAMLEDPLRAALRAPRKPVWHCSLRLAPGDRTLSDAQWGHIAREVMAQAGLAPYGDDGAIRWVAVRHADDHVHIAATLVRQDGRTEWARNDYRRVRAAVLDLERRYGLHSTAPADGTTARGVHARELNKAARQRRTEVPRERLRREVRAAAAIAADEVDFFTQLRKAGVLVRLRYSTIDPTQVTGYAVGWPGHDTREGQPVWYGGGRLASDLTLPRLRARWTPRPGAPRSQPSARWLGYDGWQDPLERAATAVRQAAEEMRADPRCAEVAGQAGADTLVMLSRQRPGKRSMAMDQAAQLLDRASRAPRGRREPVHARRADDLRAMVRLIWLMGQLSDDRPTAEMLHLLYSLAMLAEALADLREAQQRLHQARAACAAAQELRGIASAVWPGGPAKVLPTQAPSTGPSRRAYDAEQRLRGRHR